MAFIDLEMPLIECLRRSFEGCWENLIWKGRLCAENVCQWVEPCPCWWGYSVKWRSVVIKAQPAALHHCAGSLVKRVPLWGPLGGPLYWWLCYHSWIAWGKCQKALDLERSNGGKRTKTKCRKDEAHDLWHRPGPPAEFRHFHAPFVTLECAATGSSAIAASIGSIRNAVDSSTWQRPLITDVHGARELHASWIADHRGKYKLDLTSRRW